MQRFFFVAINR